MITSTLTTNDVGIVNLDLENWDMPIINAYI